MSQKRTRVAGPDVPSEETMLVAPDATLYIVPDEAALQRVARARKESAVPVDHVRGVAMEAHQPDGGDRWRWTKLQACWPSGL